MRDFSPKTRQALGQIASEVRLIGSRLFQVANDPPEMVSSHVTSYPNEIVDDALVSSLTQALYHRYYCGIRSVVSGAGADLYDDLSAANHTVDGWDSGWEIVTRAQGGTVVRRGSRVRLLTSEEFCESSGSEGSGGFMSLRILSEDIESQSAYYYAIGETLGDRYEDLVGARIYFNLTADGAVRWVECLTQSLNRHRVPFQFKVLRYQAFYSRVDGGILYIPRRYAGFVGTMITAFRDHVGGVGVRTPMFTRRIARGIAIADNPAGGLSFGLSRMKLVSEGLVDAWHDGHSDVSARVDAITSRFRRSGLDPRRPWLSPGNTEIELDSKAATSTRSFQRNVDSSADWLKIADRIGCELVRDAIWHRDRCIWLGSLLIPGNDGYRAGLGTVGCDLYSGTPGIGLFMARLAAVSHDERQRQTAIGALRHAADRACVGYWSVGAYSGLGGVLYATIGVADALQCDELATQTVPMLVKRIARSNPDDTALDILNGRAGAIRALLFAARRGLDPNRLATETAVRFGHDIVRLADRSGEDDAWSWMTLPNTTIRNLLGYSHGAAGIACALDDLFCASGDSAFREAADHALDYVTSLFDHDQRNWPDFRADAIPSDARTMGEQRSMCAWCHGASGIALALARHIGFSPQDRPRFQNLLDMSIDTILDTITGRSPLPDESFCLCHGVAGNAEIILDVSALSARADLESIVVSVARAGTENYDASGTWKCGVPGGGGSPGLLLGLAGIGHFFLRLHDRSIPSGLFL